MRILFSALLLTLFSRRFGGNVWIHALGWWLILSTLNLHFLGSSFARTMLLDHGVSNRLRRLLVFALAISLAAFVWLWAKNTLPAMTAADRANFTSLLNYAQLRADRRPRPVSALSVSLAGASVLRAGRGSVFDRAGSGAAAFFAPLLLGHFFRRGLRGSLGGSVAKTGHAHRRRPRRQLAWRNEKTKSPARVVPARGHRPGRDRADVEKSHRRRADFFPPAYGLFSPSF